MGEFKTYRQLRKYIEKNNKNDDAIIKWKIVREDEVEQVDYHINKMMVEGYFNIENLQSLIPKGLTLVVDYSPIKFKGVREEGEVDYHYESSYELSVIEGEDLIDDVVEVINSTTDVLLHYRGDSEIEFYWSSYRQDMLRISKEFPNSVLKLNVSYLDYTDGFTEYYKNGKYQYEDDLDGKFVKSKLKKPSVYAVLKTDFTNFFK